MKILIVITKSELGGAQVFALNLAKGLKKVGHDVTVAGGPGEYLPFELKKAGLSFYRLNKLERSSNPLKALGFIAELKNYVSSEKFDVVHLNSTNALLGVWSLSDINPKPRIVFTVHGLSLLDGGHKAAKGLKFFYRIFFKAAFMAVDRLVFVSRLNYDFALNSGLLDRGLKEKSSLIYNGLDLAPNYLLSRAQARQKLAEIIKEKSGLGNIDKSENNRPDLSEAYIYGSIGRLAYPKNYEFLINSFKAIKLLMPSAKLLIIGEGPERMKYEGLIKSYKLENEVYLGGEVQEAGKYLLAFDLFVLPSVFEGLSLSLIEALMAGVPVLASRVGGNEEVIGVKNCFKLNDQADFINKIKEIDDKNINKEESQGEINENDKNVNSELESKIDFSATTMTKKYLELYS